MKEPKFIKLYTNSIEILQDIPKQANNLLLVLISDYLDFNNKINLNAAIKRNIAKKLNTNESVIRQQISNLSKKKVLIRKDTGLYILNPQIMLKGDYKTVQEIIKDIK